MTKKIAISLTFVAVLAVVGGLVIGRSGANARPNDDTARRVAEEFLTSLHNKQPDQAWERTTSDFKSFRGKAVFRKFVLSKPILSSTLSFESIAVEKAEERTVTVSTFVATGKPGHVRIAVAFDAGEWRVDALTVD